MLKAIRMIGVLVVVVFLVYIAAFDIGVYTRWDSFPYFALVALSFGALWFIIKPVKITRRGN